MHVFVSVLHSDRRIINKNEWKIKENELVIPGKLAKKTKSAREILVLDADIGVRERGWEMKENGSWRSPLFQNVVSLKEEWKTWRGHTRLVGGFGSLV